MNRQKQLDLIRQKKPALLEGKDTAKMSDQEIATLARMAAEVSLDDIRTLLSKAVRDRFNTSKTPEGSTNPIEIYAYIEEVYPSYLIYSIDSVYFKIAWSIMDGKATLADTPIQVEQTWTESQAASMGLTPLAAHVGYAADDECSLIVRMAKSKNPEGTEWEVIICEPYFTKNGFYMAEDMLSRADTVAAFEGLDVNLYDLPNGVTHVPEPLFDIKSLLVRNKVGWLDNVKYAAGKGLTGVVHFLDSAKWLGKNMLAAMSEGKSIYGLSWDARIRGALDVIQGKTVKRIDGFTRADSLDIVSRPAAGGKFIRAVAGMPAHEKEDFKMKSLLALIKQKRPDLLNGKDEAALTDQEIMGLARMAIDKPADGQIDLSTVVTKDELNIIRCGMALDNKLADKDLGLPKESIVRIRTQFEGRAFASEDLDKAITGEKEFMASIIKSATGTESIPARSVLGGLGSFERACMAADKLFGLKKEDMVNMAKLTRLDNKPFFEDVRSVQDYDDFDNVPGFSSIRDMYQYFTGDTEVSGRFNRKALASELRSSMDITSATFGYVLGNSLGRRLVGIYKAMDFMEKLLISVKKSVKDFRTQEAVLVGGFPDLETADPETGDYKEIAGVTDEESTYTVAGKGNILSVTRKLIINDDISIIQRMLDGLARAARRTHGKYVWALATSNANCSDGTAMFTSGHGNLGSTALSHVTALAAYVALGKMTEKDSGERIGLLSDPSVRPNLIGPIDLMTTIDQIANDEFYYTSNDLTTKTRNGLKGKVNGVVNPMLTDTNNWFLLLPPELIDLIEMGYLNGREEPELFIADGVQAEQVFVADKVRYKIRHEYAGANIDYRGGYGAIVT